jgi:hypothetical protein
MMAERDILLAHTTILRWVQRYVPDFEKRWQAYAQPVGDSWRADETYIKVHGQCSDKHAFEVSVAPNGHRLLVAGIALVSGFQYHFQGCRLQNKPKPRLPPRRKAGREVRAPAPGVLRYNRAVLQLKFVWIVK